MKSIHAHLLLLICSIIATSCVGLLYFYMYKTVGSSTIKALAAASVVRSQIRSSAEQKRNQQIYNDTKSDRQKLNTFFINDADAVSFIESLESLEGQSGTKIELTNVTADDASNVKSNAVANIKGHVQASGSWGNIMRVLMLAESLPYQSHLENVHLDIGGEDIKSKQQSWSLSFDVVAQLVHYSTTTPSLP